ncbi:MAG: MG2 domain-containing protein, partial [Proteobacteria bacterium]|nr:MG2 domain-containing protein [Pseudomonadota bacterium]
MKAFISAYLAAIFLAWATGSAPASASEIPEAKLYANGEQPRVCVTFGTKIDRNNARVLQEFVTVKPASRLEVMERDGKLCVSGFSWGRDFALTLRAGLPLSDGAVLDASKIFKFTVPNAPASVGFAGDGYILGYTQDARLPLTTRNVGAAALTVLRIVDRNLIERLRSPGGFTKNLRGWDIDSLSENEGEIIWQGNVDIDGKPNEMVKTGIPLDDIIDFKVPGVHVVVAQDPNQEPGRWANRATQWVIVSDLGVTTFRSNAGLSVFVSSHTTTQPVAAATVALVARSNRILGKVITDADGLVRFAPGLLRGKGGASPVGLLIYHGDRDFTALSLVGPALDLSDRDVAGREPSGPVDAFLYGDRDIYRPGETVHLSGLVRDKAARALDALPLILNLVRPDGKIFTSLRPKTTAAGMLTVSVALPRSAPTGPWQAFLYIDPAQPPVGTMRISVADFVPQRLELKITSRSEIAAPEKTITVTGSGRYLFGAPAGDLDVTAELLIERDPKPFADYPDYAFGLVTDEWRPAREELPTQRTAADGTYAIPVTLPAVGDTTLPLRARVRATLLEPGGRGVTRSTAFPIRKADAVSIGIRPQFTSVGQGEAVGFDVIALNASGTPATDKTLAWELIRERHHYDWIRVRGTWDVQVSIRNETIASGKLTTANRAVAVSTNVDWGHYRLEVHDPATGAASSTRFKAGWWAEGENKATPDAVSLSLDKDKYRAGETARLRINPPYAGTALLTVLNDGVLEARRIQVPKEGLETNLTVRKEWGIAGAYVAVTLLKPGTRSS